MTIPIQETIREKRTQENQDNNPNDSTSESDSDGNNSGNSDNSDNSDNTNGEPAPSSEPEITNLQRQVQCQSLFTRKAQKLGYAVGQVAGDFELIDQYGKNLRLSDFCGNTVLLVATAFW